MTSPTPNSDSDDASDDDDTCARMANTMDHAAVQHTSVGGKHPCMFESDRKRSASQMPEEEGRHKSPRGCSGDEEEEYDEDEEEGEGDDAEGDFDATRADACSLSSGEDLCDRVQALEAENADLKRQLANMEADNKRMSSTVSALCMRLDRIDQTTKHNHYKIRKLESKMPSARASTASVASHSESRLTLSSSLSSIGSPSCSSMVDFSPASSSMTPQVQSLSLSESSTDLFKPTHESRFETAIAELRGKFPRIDFVSTHELKKVALEYLSDVEKREPAIFEFNKRVEDAVFQGETPPTRPAEADYPDCPRIDLGSIARPEHDEKKCATCGKRGILVNCTGCERGFHSNCVDEERQPEGGSRPFYCMRDDCAESFFLKCIGYKPKCIPAETFDCAICLDTLNVGLKCQLKGNCSNQHAFACITCIEKQLYCRGEEHEDMIPCFLCRGALSSVIRPGAVTAEPLCTFDRTGRDDDTDEDVMDRQQVGEHVRSNRTRRPAVRRTRDDIQMQRDMERAAEESVRSLQRNVAMQVASGEQIDDQRLVEVMNGFADEHVPDDELDDEALAIAKAKARNLANQESGGRPPPKERAAIPVAKPKEAKQAVALVPVVPPATSVERPKQAKQEARRKKGKLTVFGNSPASFVPVSSGEYEID